MNSVYCLPNQVLKQEKLIRTRNNEWTSHSQKKKKNRNYFPTFENRICIQPNFPEFRRLENLCIHNPDLHYSNF